MNIKNKKIYLLVFSLVVLGLFGEIHKTYAAECRCYDENQEDTISWPDGQAGGPSSEDKCHQNCANYSGKYYKYGICLWGSCIEKVTKQQNAKPFQETSTVSTSSSSGNFSYTPMEAIPGFEGKTNDFPSYVLALYKFGLWTIGIAAVLMISIGGYMYLTSAGNNSSVEKAKSIITDALIGFVLAMVSWLILYIINPDLVSFTSLNQVMDKAARSYDGTYPVITNDMPKDCNAQEWQDLFSKVSQSSGIDKCALQALAAIESGCNKVPSRTQGGRDCSVVQIAAHDNCQTTCEDLETNPQKALECGARYLNKCSSNYRTNNEEQKLRDMYAGYNGGCGALSSSNSCSGMTNGFGNPYMKWDCPKDCGGYCPVPARTSVFLNYYNQCKSK